jgi:hypothetical protein
MRTRTLTGIAAGAVLVGASLLGTATPAFAETLHGPYTSHAKCVTSANNYEWHGYVIFYNCYYTSNGWFFITTP